MDEPRRRKSDQSAYAWPPGGPGLGAGHLDADEWVLRCQARIRELEPGMSAYEATEIAYSMWLFERTGVMAPEEAVNFVVGQMQPDSAPRLERRGDRRARAAVTGMMERLRPLPAIDLEIDTAT